MFSPDVYEKLGAFWLGRERDNPASPVLYDSKNLTTHGVCVGMTGSGKTGLCIALLEEALIDGVPAIVIDPKGDITNLALRFPNLSPAEFAPWTDQPEKMAKVWTEGLASWGEGPDRVARFKDAGEVVVYTPGSSAGRMVSIVGSLAAPSVETRDDAEEFAERVSGTATNLLSLLGIDVDPLQSSEHVFLSNLLTSFWRQGRDLDLAQLIGSIQNPPFEKIGVLDLDTVFDKKERASLAIRMNNLLAAPGFAAWLEGEPLDIASMLRTVDGKPKVSIFTISHLSEAERMFFVSMLLGAFVDWTRAQSGTNALRAILYMDEIFGYLPPVANPPSKRPLLTLLKQARAFGVGTLLATQNPVDVDYKGLSNAGTWFLGRLQTERDVDRVIDGLLAADSGDSLDRATVRDTLGGLKSRQFLLHNVHEGAPYVFETRWVLSYLRGPMTKEDIRRLDQARPEPTIPGPAEPAEAEAPAATASKGWYLPIRVPQKDADELLWRPMAYGAGSVSFGDEEIPFGYIRGLQGESSSFDWAESTATMLQSDGFADAAGSGQHLELGQPVDCAVWRDALERHVASTVAERTFRCPKLRLRSEPGEGEADFRARVDLAIREKRDAAVAKLRGQFEKKIERLGDRLDRAQDTLERERDQASSAQLEAAVNVGEALVSMFGVGRSRRVSSTRATRVMKERRDVERAEGKAQAVVADIYALQSEMEAAIADEEAEFERSNFPVEVDEKASRARDIHVQFCDLVWVPYWKSPDGSRRRAF